MIAAGVIGRGAFPAAPRPEALRRLTRVSNVGSAMGGRLGIHLAVNAWREAAVEAAERDAVRTADRIRAWARLLTRFEQASDLVALNDDPREAVPVGPTLAALLAWGIEAGRLTSGIVDIALLDARLAAEAGAASTQRPGVIDGAAWSVLETADGPVVVRPAGVRFDLDGVGKGWLADRALALLWRHPGVIVDADGDLAIQVAPGDTWQIGIADPTRAGLDLAVVALHGSDVAPTRFGLATSGTSVHRWQTDGRVGHHLIDPRTGFSADTDVVQATVLAATAREAEALAKTAVVLGSVTGLDFLDRSGVSGAVILTTGGERLALPGTLRWLA